VLPLKNLRDIKRISKSWYFSKNLHFFQISLANNKLHIFGCKTEKAVENWIKNIKEAKVHSEKNM